MYRRYRGSMPLWEAAEKLGVSTKQLSRYEKKETIPHSEIVVDMAKIYNAPQLPYDHCSLMCPIGQALFYQLEKKNLSQSVLSLLKELNDVKKMKEKLIDIASDGVIDKSEEIVFNQILKELCELEKSIGEIKKLASFSKVKTIMKSIKKEPVLATQAL